MLLLLLCRPAQQRIHAQRVMYVHHERHAGVHRRERLDCQHRIEKAATGAAQFFGNLNAHQPQFEEPLHQPRGQMLFLVHGAHQRRNRLLGKLQDGRIKKVLFFRKLRECVGASFGSQWNLPPALKCIKTGGLRVVTGLPSPTSASGSASSTAFSRFQSPASTSLVELRLNRHLVLARLRTAPGRLAFVFSYSGLVLGLTVRLRGMQSGIGAGIFPI